jgi:hypothetical protein
VHKAQRRRSRFLAGGITGILMIVAVVVASPPPQTATALMQTSLSDISQTLEVAPTAATSVVERGGYSATPGIATLVAGGTNADWAKLVLLSGGFPMSDSNVTVLLRWMRQENGADNWWNRNNPLNNGYGSGGGGGTGRYPNLVVAAQKAAEALHHNRGYAGIVAALAASAPTEVVERAIWDSPWASGHYANGGHWHYNDVPIYTAPAGAWG